MLKKRLLRWYFKLIGKRPIDMPMVKYWMYGVSAEARVVNRDGSLEMDIKGEKYPIRGLPRGHILFGKLSKLKHEIKNQIFNQSWKLLEEGNDPKDVLQRIKILLKGGLKVTDPSPVNQEEYQVGQDLMDLLKYDLEPYKKLVPPVREIHRAWTKIGGPLGLRDMVCSILQEDDSYRYRVQWLAEWFPFWMKLNPAKYFEYALGVLEHGEVVGDMKERIKLLKRILILTLQDPEIKRMFNALFREIHWDKVRMSEGDKFHFRGKYFKVDYGIFDY